MSAGTMNTSSSHENRSQLLALAKDGDITALESLIKSTLLPLGVEVMAANGNNCLVITAVLPETVDRLFLINFVREGLERLQADSIERVVIVGRDRARINPDWQYILNLYQADLPLIPTPANQHRARRSNEQTPRLTFRQRHPLFSKPLHLLMFVLACGLLVAGAFAAKTVFVLEDGGKQQIKLPR
jgi:hypothetical protein